MFGCAHRNEHFPFLDFTNRRLWLAFVHHMSRPWQKIQCFRALSHSRIVQGPQKNSSGKAGHLQTLAVRRAPSSPIKKNNPIKKREMRDTQKERTARKAGIEVRVRLSIISKSGSRLGSVGGKQLVFSTSFPLFWPWTKLWTAECTQWCWMPNCCAASVASGVIAAPPSVEVAFACIDPWASLDLPSIQWN